MGSLDTVGLVGSREVLMRRRHVITAGAAAIGAAAWSSQLRAVELSAVEQANVKVVNDMCAAWVAPLDSAKLGALLANDCVFRASETTPPKIGRATVLEFIEGIMDDVTHCEFEVGDTFARGSIVAHERWDRFVRPTRKSEWHVIGVFYVKDGLIAEWSDYIIA